MKIVLYNLLLCRLSYSFTECRMGMDHSCYLFFCQSGANGQGQLCYRVCSPGAHELRTHYHMIFFPIDDLHKAPFLPLSLRHLPSNQKKYPFTTMSTRNLYSHTIHPLSKYLSSLMNAHLILRKDPLIST